MRLSVSHAALLAGLVAAPGAASAACTSNVAGDHIFALAGDACLTRGGAYNPVGGTTVLPFPDPGYGFVAYNGGTVTASGAVTITTTDANPGATAVLSRGAGSLVTLGAGAVLTTFTAGANGVQADLGGHVTLGSADAASTISADGEGAHALIATGDTSRIDAFNVTAASVLDAARPVLADQGATIALTGGAFSTAGRIAATVTASNGATVTLNGTHVTADGDGSVALLATSGGTIQGTGLVIESSGNVDEATGAGSGGVRNASDGTGPKSGGTVDLSASTILVTGNSGFGVYTANRGVTTLSDDKITIQSSNGVGVWSGAGGKTTILGGAIETTGTGAIGLLASGGGQLTTGLRLGTGLSVTTTGANAFGAEADSTGALTLNGGSVKTAGDGSVGLYATGANSVIGATDVSVATAGGQFAYGLLAVDGGAVAMKGGTATTSGDDVAVAVAAGGKLNLNGTQLLASGLGAAGVLVNGGGASFIGNGLTIVTHGDLDDANGFAAFGVANQGAGLHTGGGTVTLSDSAVTTTGAGAVGVLNSDGGSMKITGGSISTVGAGAHGFFAANGAQTLLSGLRIDTAGAQAIGLAVQGDATRLDGSDLRVTTSGAGSYALFNGNGDGSAGGSSGGAHVSLTGATLVTTGDFARGAVSENGGFTTLTSTSIKTSGLQADAVFGSSGAQITLAGAQLTTLGNAAKGLDIEGSGTQLIGSDLTISTAGTTDPVSGFHAQGVYNGSSVPAGAGTTGGGIVTLTRTDVATRGVDAFGVDTANGGQTTLTGGSVTTAGAGAVALLASQNASVTASADPGGQALKLTTSGASAIAALAQSHATITLTGVAIETTGAGALGLVVNDSGSTLTANQVSVRTNGGRDAATGFYAAGAYNGPGARGTSGGAMTLNAVGVETFGAGAAGLVTGAGGVTDVTGGGFATSGADAAAVRVVNSGVITLNGAVLGTVGDGSSGLVINGPGGKITASNLTIATGGGISAATSAHADGLFNGAFGSFTSGGQMTVSTSTVVTKGDQSYGVSVAAGGTTSFLGGSVVTLGAGATALRVRDGGALDVGTDTRGAGTSVLTNGASAFGAYAFNGGLLTLTGTSIQTTGAGAAGLAVNDAATQVQAASVTIATTGDDAFGVDNGAGGAAGGQLTLVDAKVTTKAALTGAVRTASGVTQIGGGVFSTSGAGAVAVTAAGGATTLARNGAGAGFSLATSGLSAAGALATGGALTLNGGAIATTGDGSVGLAVRGAGATVSATGVTIATQGGLDAATGQYAYAVHNGPGAGGASGGQLTLDAVTASTRGDHTAALLTGAGGVTAVNGGAFSTLGADAAAAYAVDGGKLNIAGAALTTSGDGSAGLLLSGAGAITAANLTIATTGGVSAASGNHADGVYNGAFGSFAGGGAMQIADSSVHTSGAQAYGVSVGAGGTTTFDGGAIATLGAAAHAAHAANGGSLALGLDSVGKGAALSTIGAGAFGALAESGGLLTLNGATVATTGGQAHGLAADGAGSKMTASGAGVSTTGAGAFGALAQNGGLLSFSGGAVATTGDQAHGLAVEGAGSQMSVAGARVTTTGAGASAAFVADGGALTLGAGTVLSASGANALVVTGAGSTASLGSSVTLVAKGAAASALSVQNGGAVTIAGPLALVGAATGLTINGGASPGTVNVGGALTIQTTAGGGAALALTGDNAVFDGKSGGQIDAAGVAISLTKGVGQSASFTGYTINSLSGDLIFVDPAATTVSFTDTTANAGTGHVLNAAGGSVVLNASASQLTGAIATSATAVSTVNLQADSNWSVTGDSLVTNLNVNRSTVSFAPTAGGFSALTVNNYSGQSANLMINATLGGANPGADRLVIDGGAASGSTTIYVRPVAFAAPTATPAPATPAAVPVVVTTNGGTVAPGAFTLSGPVVSGDFLYTLQAQNGGEYLVPGQGMTSGQANGSVATLAQSRQTQAVTARVLGSILTGATEQINCSACASGFASFGSFALGLHGRWTLSPSVSVLAGASYDNYTGKGVTVNNALIGALAVRYDMVQLGRNRPFFEAGLAVQPYANVTYKRSYQSTLGGATGVGNTLSRSVAAYGRAGYIWRLGRTDEAAAYTDLTRSWQSTGGYIEGATGGNPFGAIVAPSVDTMNVWKIGAQWTHLFGQHVEGNVSAGYARAFGANYGSTAAIAGFGGAAGTAPASFGWAELGGRVSYRFSNTIIGDAFMLGTVGAEPAGNQLHGGLALRMAF